MKGMFFYRKLDRGESVIDNGDGSFILNRKVNLNKSHLASDYAKIPLF